MKDILNQWQNHWVFCFCDTKENNWEMMVLYRCISIHVITENAKIDPL